MAKIISEDDKILSSFELILSSEQIENRDFISWVPYKIVLLSAEKKLVYEKKDNNSGAGDYVFALKPVNEIKDMISGIENFLVDLNKQIFSFEPIEPSFEIVIERSHKGYSFNCWLDAGNVISDHYSWDGFGLRFFTTEEKIRLFLKELIAETKAL